MPTASPIEKPRQRAPSRRSLATRERILDAAERLFAESGFDGTSLRDIAALAATPVGLVHHHGGDKEGLFRQAVARRAEELSRLRIDALERRKASGPLSLPAILECFFGPYLEKAEAGGPQWLAYARLVAHVSADPRWRAITEQCFDPTASRFIDEIAALYPAGNRQTIATGFVYSVSALLALLTSRWRIAALGNSTPDARADLAGLVGFCAAGIEAGLARDGAVPVR